MTKFSWNRKFERILKIIIILIHWNDPIIEFWFLVVATPIFVFSILNDYITSSLISLIYKGRDNKVLKTLVKKKNRRIFIKNLLFMQKIYLFDFLNNSLEIFVNIFLI